MFKISICCGTILLVCLDIILELIVLLCLISTLELHLSPVVTTGFSSILLPSAIIVHYKLNILNPYVKNNMN